LSNGISDGTLTISGDIAWESRRHKARPTQPDAPDEIEAAVGVFQRQARLKRRGHERHPED
jgi:hypothetical protein